MRIWFGLIAAPLLALADQSLAFATVEWACGHQRDFAVHAVHAVLLAAIVVATLPACQLFRRTPAVYGDREDLARRHFLAGLASASGALSALAVIAMWFPVWVLGPCLN